jgi:hypothetical protein
MKRRPRLRFVARATSNRFELSHALSFDKATHSAALEPRKPSGQKLRDNGNRLTVTKPFECGAARRVHLFPKGAELSRIMPKDAIRRFLAFI